MFVEFEGVYRDAVVWVNGSFAGHHPYGYTGFALAIDHLVRHGEENEIRVDVTAQEDARWYSGAGIYRNVKLVVGEPVHLALDSLWVTTPEIDDELAVVAGDGGRRERRRGDAPDVGGDRDRRRPRCGRRFRGVAVDELPAASRRRVRQRLVVPDPRRWSLDAPTLYTCRVVVRDGDGVEIDRDETTFGIRSLQVDAARGLRINGEVVNLRGACIHHDNGVIGAATVERADERRIEILKASGFNAIRSAHHPASKALLDACDRLGMLVMDEAFDMWIHPKMRNDYARVFPEWWETDIDAMVRKDRNHPSVILYSIGNEIPDTGDPTGADLGRRLAERVRALDDTRYVTNGVNPIISVGIQTIIAMASPPPTRRRRRRRRGEENAGINTVMQRLRAALPALMQSEEVAEKLDEPYSYLDVAGYNYSDARYELDGDAHAEPGHRGHRDPQHQHRPELAEGAGPPARDRRLHLDRMGLPRRGRPRPRRVRRGQRPVHGRLPLARRLVRRHRHHRSAATALVPPRDRVRAARRTVRLGAGSGAPRPDAVAPGVGRRTVARGPGLVVVARLRGPPGHRRRPERRRRGGARGQRQLGRPATGGRGAPLPRRRSRRPSSPARSSPSPTATGPRSPAPRCSPATGLAALDVRVDRTEIRADDTDLAYVDITLVDDDGRLHHTEDRAVTVEVEGPGTLQGLGSANPRTEETFGEPTHDTFHGRALAVVRPTAPGTITVTVTTDGLASQQVTIEAR